MMTSTSYGTGVHRFCADSFSALRNVTILLGILCIPVFCTAPLHAQTTESSSVEQVVAPDDTPVSADTHLIIFTGFTSEEDQETFRQAISSQLADIDKTIIFDAIDASALAANQPDARIQSLMASYQAGTAFVVTPAESRIDLTIVRDTADGIVATRRPVEATHGSPQHEALAVIIRATILAIEEQQSLPQEAEPAEMQNPKPNPTAPTPARPPATRQPGDRVRSGRIFVETSLALGYYSSDTTIWPGAALALGWSPIEQLVFHVDYILFAQIEKRTPELTLSLTRHPIYFGVQLRKRRGNTFLGGGLALSIDIISEKITPHTSQVDSENNPPLTMPGLYGYLQFGMRIAKRVRFFIRPGIEVPFRQTMYSFNGIESDKLIVRPLVAQPSFRAGLQVDFF
ncbi:MAG: hypothetical protein JXX14_19645 [Deltaproteobacteria bacterium]|nr:hypothetical protein [Deltaproteobacteria bacterium]